MVLTKLLEGLKADRLDDDDALHGVRNGFMGGTARDRHSATIKID